MERYKNIEDIIKKFNLNKIDIIKINKEMHEDIDYLRFPEGILWDKFYLNLFYKHAKKYKENKLRKKDN